jgi:hypothetical protein
VGNNGDSGIVEISDLIISTTGGSQGAVGIEWNVNGVHQGDTGMWDVHVRLGGALGEHLRRNGSRITDCNARHQCTTFRVSDDIYGSHQVRDGIHWIPYRAFRIWVL